MCVWKSMEEHFQESAAIMVKGAGVLLTGEYWFRYPKVKAFMLQWNIEGHDRCQGRESSPFIFFLFFLKKKLILFFKFIFYF